MEYLAIDPLEELLKAYCIVNEIPWSHDEVAWIATRVKRKRSEEIDFSHNINEQKDFLK